MNAIDIRDEVTSDDEDYVGQYDGMLNEAYDCDFTRKFGDAAHIIKQVDPIAYTCGFNDWMEGYPTPWRCEECGTMYEDEAMAEECCLST